MFCCGCMRRKNVVSVDAGIPSDTINSSLRGPIISVVSTLPQPSVDATSTVNSSSSSTSEHIIPTSLTQSTLVQTVAKVAGATLACVEPPSVVNVTVPMRIRKPRDESFLLTAAEEMLSRSSTLCRLPTYTPTQDEQHIVASSKKLLRHLSNRRVLPSVVHGRAVIDDGSPQSHNVSPSVVPSVLHRTITYVCPQPLRPGDRANMFIRPSTPSPLTLPPQAHIASVVSSEGRGISHATRDFEGDFYDSYAVAPGQTIATSSYVARPDSTSREGNESGYIADSELFNEKPIYYSHRTCAMAVPTLPLARLQERQQSGPLTDEYRAPGMSPWITSNESPTNSPAVGSEEKAKT